jgi:hypothetical protein
LVIVGFFARVFADPDPVAAQIFQIAGKQVFSEFFVLGEGA